MGGIERQHDDRTARDPAHFLQALRLVRPVMHRQDRHRRVERLVGEGQRLGMALNRWCGGGLALADHFGRRLDGCHRPVGRLVRSGAGADIENATRRTQRSQNRRGNARIGLSQVGIIHPDAIVDRRTLLTHRQR